MPTAEDIGPIPMGEHPTLDSASAHSTPSAHITHNNLLTAVINQLYMKVNFFTYRVYTYPFVCLLGFITGKLLCILDKLDRYNFDRAKTSPAINQIYDEIISIWNEKTNNEVSISSYSTDNKVSYNNKGSISFRGK